MGRRRRHRGGVRIAARAADGSGPDTSTRHDPDPDGHADPHHGRRSPCRGCRGRRGAAVDEGWGQGRQAPAAARGRHRVPDRRQARKRWRSVVAGARQWRRLRGTQGGLGGRAHCRRGVGPRAGQPRLPARRSTSIGVGAPQRAVVPARLLRPRGAGAEGHRHLPAVKRRRWLAGRALDGRVPLVRAGRRAPVERPRVASLLDGDTGGSVRERHAVRGHFDDPGSTHCVGIGLGGTIGSNAGPGEPGAIALCRQQFVVTELLPASDG